MMLRAALFSLSLLTAFAAPAFANGMTAEQVVEVAVITVDEQGVETKSFTPAGEIAPGDEVRYTLNYANQGDESAENVNLVMPVPAEVNFIEGSAEPGPATLSFSADGGATFMPREALIVETEEGTRLAAADEITHLKWSFGEDIAAGATGQVSFGGTLQ